MSQGARAIRMESLGWCFFRDKNHKGGVEVRREGGARYDVKAESIQGLKDRGGIQGDDPIGVGDTVGARGGVAKGGEDLAEVLNGEGLDKFEKIVGKRLAEEGAEIGKVV